MHEAECLAECLLRGNTYRKSLSRQTDSQRPPCQTRGMDLSKMTTAEVEVLLRLLTESELRELMLMMLERRQAERDGQLH